MKVRVKEVIQDDSITKVILSTPIGDFCGNALFNKEEDPLPPSKMIGGRIAEDRAYIAFYNQLIAQKRIELKTVKRLLNGSNPKKSGYKHIEKIYNTIQLELSEIKMRKEWYQTDIHVAIEGRKIYVRSRTEDKEEKEKKLQALGNAIATLGQNTPKE